MSDDCNLALLQFSIPFVYQTLAMFILLHTVTLSQRSLVGSWMLASTLCPIAAVVLMTEQSCFKHLAPLFCFV